MLRRGKFLGSCEIRNMMQNVSPLSAKSEALGQAAQHRQDRLQPGEFIQTRMVVEGDPALRKLSDPKYFCKGWDSDQVHAHADHLISLDRLGIFIN